MSFLLIKGWRLWKINCPLNIKIFEILAIVDQIKTKTYALRRLLVQLPLIMFI